MIYKKSWKYILIKNDSYWCNNSCFQIKSLKDFSDISQGDLGGYVDGFRNLSQAGNCWIYNEAAVLGFANISENAIARNYAVISGFARVSGNAEIFESAMIDGKAMVIGNSKVYGASWIMNDSIISENSRVFDSAKVLHKAIIKGNARIFERAIVRDTAIVGGNAEISGNVSVCNNTRVSDTKISGNKVIAK